MTTSLGPMACWGTVLITPRVIETNPTAVLVAVRVTIGGFQHRIRAAGQVTGDVGARLLFSSFEYWATVIGPDLPGQPVRYRYRHPSVTFTHRCLGNVETRFHTGYASLASAALLTTTL